MHPFSLYLHIPYCHSKCPYCDFNSHAATRWPETEYVGALIAELEHYATQPEWRGGIQTIFFGGGTPSLFAPDSIATVLEAVWRLWPQDSRQRAVGSGQLQDALTADCPLPTAYSPEVTLEANPGTIALDKLRGFRDAGINRISFGVQSFHPHHLSTLGRIHSADEAIVAIESARRAGFDNLNLDLIFAVPGQTLDEWEADLRTAIALSPDHISAYNLTFEEGTAFHAMRAKGQLVQAPEEIEVAMFTGTRELLATAGYAPYEISNFARPQRECRHNLNYWRGGGYLGVGAGAHSFSRTPTSGRRWSNEKNPALYIHRVAQHAHARSSEETLAAPQAQGEFVFLNLRLRDGFAARDFTNRFGVDFIEAFPHAATLRQDGLLVSTDAHWRLSERGLLLADSVFATFL
ncbi:MAG TPA: radical SAM family heme chaperone HemW [Candidatus Kryptonia bacterium]|nr:radical SAM family heme chaperone HemW [Candidatus Kryptonia bacterium]